MKLCFSQLFLLLVLRLNSDPCHTYFILFLFFLPQNTLLLRAIPGLNDIGKALLGRKALLICKIFLLSVS